MPYHNYKIGLFIPTLNAGSLWVEVLEAINQQTVNIERKIVADCCSSDDTVALAKQYGFEIHKIHKEAFDHGGTRNLAFQLCKGCDIVVFITQDVILDNTDAFKNLLGSFADDNITAAYGRQVPHKDATPISCFERQMNYGSKELVQEKASIKELGYGVSFCSNAFAAYRIKDVLKLGGFPERVIFGEDACLTSKIVLAGNKVMYNPKAIARHSHNYSIVQQFKRYFDIGVFFREEQWIADAFGKPQSKAVKFVFGGITYLFPKKAIWIPQYVMLTIAKFIGFKLGKMYRLLPQRMVRSFTMNPSYWKRMA